MFDKLRGSPLFDLCFFIYWGSHPVTLMAEMIGKKQEKNLSMLSHAALDAPSLSDVHMGISVLTDYFER